MTEKILIFGDETYPDRPDGARVQFIALAVERSQLVQRRPAIARLKGLGTGRCEQELLELLDNPAFLISICTIDRLEVYGEKLFQTRDRYSDVGSISRTDNLWTQGFGYALTTLIATINERWNLHPVEVLYDERSLPGDLKDSTEGSLQSTLRALAETHRRQLGREGHLEITSIQQVSKMRGGDAGGLEHDGIWLVDMLGWLIRHVPEEEFNSNFLFRDQTEVAKGIHHMRVAAEHLAEDPRVRAVYGFGSHVRNESGPMSDLDLAVLFDDGLSLKEELRIRGELTQLLERDDVDFLILNHAPPLLRYEVISSEHRLYARDEQEIDEFERRVAMHSFDTAHLRATQQRLVREARR